jgi:hypothetical protein
MSSRWNVTSLKVDAVGSSHLRRPHSTRQTLENYRFAYDACKYVQLCLPESFALFQEWCEVEINRSEQESDNEFTSAPCKKSLEENQANNVTLRKREREYEGKYSENETTNRDEKQHVSCALCGVNCEGPSNLGCRSQWPRGLRHELSSLAQTLGS